MPRFGSGAFSLTLEMPHKVIDGAESTSGRRSPSTAGCFPAADAPLHGPNDAPPPGPKRPRHRAEQIRVLRVPKPEFRECDRNAAPTLQLGGNPLVQVCVDDERRLVRHTSRRRRASLAGRVRRLCRDYRRLGQLPVPVLLAEQLDHPLDPPKGHAAKAQLVDDHCFGDILVAVHKRNCRRDGRFDVAAPSPLTDAIPRDTGQPANLVGQVVSRVGPRSGSCPSGTRLYPPHSSHRATRSASSTGRWRPKPCLHGGLVITVASPLVAIDTRSVFYRIFWHEGLWEGTPCDRWYAKVQVTATSTMGHHRPTLPRCNYRACTQSRSTSSRRARGSDLQAGAGCGQRQAVVVGQGWRHRAGAVEDLGSDAHDITLRKQPVGASRGSFPGPSRSSAKLGAVQVGHDPTPMAHPPL